MQSEVGSRLTLRGYYQRADHFCASCLNMNLHPVFATVLLLAMAGLVGVVLGGLWLDQLRVVIVPGTIISVLVAWWVFWWAPRQWNSPFLREPGAECEIRADEAGLYFAAQGTQREWAWMFFIKWSESAFCFLLTLPDGRFEFVPKHLFAAREDIGAFRSLLTRHIEVRTFTRPADGRAQPPAPVEDVPVPVPELSPILGTCTRWDFVCGTYACLGIGPGFALLMLVVFGPLGALTLAGRFYWGTLMMWGPIVFMVFWLFVIQPRRWLPALLGLRREDWAGATDIGLQPAGLSISTQAGSRNYAWRDFSCWREGWFCFVLLQPAGGFEFIPKRFFNSWRDCRMFRQFLRERFARPKSTGALQRAGRVGW